MPHDKLYIKITCFACEGTKLLKHSAHHNPARPFMWKSCPYCDLDGLTLIEAHPTVVAEYLQQLPESVRTGILKQLKKKFKKK